MERVNRWLRPAAVGGLLALTLAACGESESNGNSSNADGSGGTASTADGGTSSTSTTGGTTGSGGTSGAGGTTSGPQSVMCDDTLCEGLSLGIPGGPETDACCPEDSPDEPCGVRTEFLEEYDIDLGRECQPLNSPGEFDANCPESPPLMPNDSLTLPGFPGCCLPSGKCGFLLDEALLGAVQLNLGCIDSRELPNPDFDDPPDCDPGALGAGGAP
ncbi:MAG TPA: hypothetical protein VFU02_22995 [Polyangiaceae bacterium]|nr:hypothetical protein [Polyangiaceae bacterium]